MAQMRKTPKGQSSTGKFIGTMEATKAKELKRIKEGKPTYVGKPARSKSGASTVAAVAKRFGVTAREARDIATAVGTLGKAVVTPGSNYGSQRKNKTATIVKTAGDIAKQAGETYTAATKGKSGTSAIKLNTRARNASGMPTDVEYKTGTKRKQGSKK